MKIAVLVLLACFVAASANPIFVSVVNEFQVADGNDWIEFHCVPPEGRDLHGWILETSTTNCTLDFTLEYGEFVLLDSALVACDSLAHGTFGLRPDSDSIVLRRDTLGYTERVRYPAEVGWQGTLTPGHGTSACRFNVPTHEAQCVTWYLDSTPTPGSANDDYSIVTGTVRGSGGQYFDEFYVSVLGPNGSSHDDGSGADTYEAGGLNPGRYTVRVTAFRDHTRYEWTYPDPVEVPYSTVVAGIDIVIPMTGIRESGVAREPALLGPGLLLDVSGRRVMELRRGANDVRGVRPGIYFIRRDEDDYTHKVVVQR